MLSAIPYRTMLRSALLTVLCLFGGSLVGGVLGNMLFEALPGHNLLNPSTLNVILATLPALAGSLMGSAAWGVQMGRLAQAVDARRMAVAGALGFAPITIGLIFLLGALEPVAAKQFGSQLPIHRLFTLMFVPTVFIVASVSAWAIGLGLRNMALARSLSWRVGLAAALGFLVVNLVMESLGWIVGAPRAAERFTMLTVLFAGSLAAALLGGAVMGWTLHAAMAKSTKAAAD